MDIKKTVSNNIRKIREKMGLSQFQLAQEADLSQAFLNEIENKNKYPSPASMEKICKALKIKPYILFLDSDSKNAPMTLFYNITNSNKFLNVHEKDANENLLKNNVEMLSEIKEKLKESINEEIDKILGDYF